MGMPVTIDNTKQLAKDQAEAFKDKIKSNHASWYAKFKEAEEIRRKEEHNWRALYDRIYTGEKSWYEKLGFFVLNGIQLWALTQQYNQQKKIAARTYELANRQLSIAEEMYDYYKKQFQPHEVALGQQIDNYFAKPYRPQYETTGGRFVVNARTAMIGKRREALMCASQYCTGALSSTLNNLALQEANMVGNAMNSAVKFENLREQKMESKWLKQRLSFIETGRGVSSDGRNGLDASVAVFHSFGADPGAALKQLLQTIAYTAGGLIPSPDVPYGEQQSNGVSPTWRSYNYTPSPTKVSVAY